MSVVSENSWARPTASVGLALACLVGMVLFTFGPALFENQQFAFQDAGHYYYPLLERVQQEWDAGRWPLWAPEASAGTPLIGNPTAAVLYPGKLVFFLLPHPWAVRVFLIGHVVLAFVAMATLLRAWGGSMTGSTLGALAYAFGVPVLSQTSNMIFLVGAAWAPFGLMAADRWIRLRRLTAVPALALVLALQVLGGDPEAAYLTLVCALAYAWALTMQRGRPGLSRWLLVVAATAAAALVLLVLSWLSARSMQLATSGGGAEHGAVTGIPSDALVVVGWLLTLAVVGWRSRRGRGAPICLSGLAGLIGAGVLALALAGAQLVPVLEYSRLSFRAAESLGLHDIYPYSANPLQLLDAVWPGVFGTVEGGYRSWLNALPPKSGSRFWMPSLYLGSLTLILAVAGSGAGGDGPRRGWLAGIAVVALLAAVGYYASPLFWARCLPGGETLLGPLEPPFSWQVRRDGHLRDGDGSVYWLLASALPGFRSFRYPPKLFVFCSLAVSALAGLGWDRVAAGRSRRAASLAAALLGLSLAALITSWGLDAPLRSAFGRLATQLEASDEPLDVSRALGDLRSALVHGSVAVALALALVCVAPRRPILAGAAAVVLLSLDLGLVNAHRVVFVPQAAFEAEPRALEVIRAAERASPSPGPYRIQRVGRWWPTAWSNTTAPRSFETVTRWERMTLRPNFNLPLGVESTFYFDSIEPLDYGLFFLPWSQPIDPSTANSHGLQPDQKIWYYPRRGFDLWNTRYLIVPSRLEWGNAPRGYAAFIPRSTFLYPPPGAFEGAEGPDRRRRWGATEDFRVLRNDAAFPRAWIVHRAQVLPPLRRTDAAGREQLMRTILYQGDDFWHVPGLPVRDPSASAWVETNRPRDIRRFLSGAAPDPTESVRFEHYSPQRVTLTATLHSPGLVVLADMYYPGWRLAVDGRPAEILRTNRTMRGVALPAGTHRLDFYYAPGSFRLGLVLSVAGLVAWIVLLAFARLGPARASH